tara:strand:- start:341 stop:532 length:192 start_codon:yes stop_codon:yes gene_type:complete
MPVPDAYLMDLQIEDLMYDRIGILYDQMDAQELEDADFPDWFLTDDDQDLEAFSLECAFGPEE